ncbi:MAG: hypothetical protein GY941_11480 [Planctomycetes bacterium]|nr:hypothetical protein [Planctomycetota bacterium]
MELSKKSIRLLQKAVKGKKKKLHPVVVCTDKRGVVFGYTKNIHADPIKLKNARMCLYWPETIGGVFGLGEIGPNAETKISAPLPSISLPGITAVFSVTDKSEKAWNDAPVQGR